MNSRQALQSGHTTASSRSPRSRGATGGPSARDRRARMRSWLYSTSGAGMVMRGASGDRQRCSGERRAGRPQAGSAQQTAPGPSAPRQTSARQLQAARDARRGVAASQESARPGQAETMAGDAHLFGQGPGAGPAAARRGGAAARHPAPRQRSPPSPLPQRSQRGAQLAGQAAPAAWAVRRPAGADGPARI